METNYFFSLPNEIKGAIALLSFFVLWGILFMFKKILFSSKNETNPKKISRSEQEINNYWTKERLREYQKNQQKDPQKYGYI